MLPDAVRQARARGRAASDMGQKARGGAALGDRWKSERRAGSGRGRFIRCGAADESGAAGGERYGQKMSVGGSALYWAKASAAHGE